MSSTPSQSSLSAQINELSLSSAEAAKDTNTDQAPAELAAAVDDLLNQLNTNFSQVSGDLIAKMDDMSRRLDNLEATILAGNEGGAGEGGNEGK